MDVRKGRINNINKKIIAGALVFALAGVPLAGCNAVSIDDIKYSTNVNGDIQGIDGVVSSNTLNYCSFYTVYNNETNERYCTIGLMDEWNGTYFIKYYDIFTKEELVPAKFSFKSIKSVNEYLNEINKIKQEYTEEELKQILNMFVETLEGNKKLVKE